MNLLFVGGANINIFNSPYRFRQFDDFFQQSHPKDEFTPFIAIFAVPNHHTIERK